MKVHVMWENEAQLKPAIPRKMYFFFQFNYAALCFFSVYVCNSFRTLNNMYALGIESSEWTCKKKKTRRNLLFVRIRNCKMVIFHMIVHSHLFLSLTRLLMSMCCSFVLCWCWAKLHARMDEQKKVHEIKVTFFYKI